MAEKRSKPWVWDLDREEKLFKKFRKNFARQDPLFAKWADCLFTICSLREKAKDGSESTLTASGDPEETTDPIIHELGFMLAHEPTREAERLYYLNHIFFNSSSINHEAAGHDICAVMGVALEYKNKRSPQ